MSVLIKIDMPKEKSVAVVIHPDGTAYTAEMSAGVCTEYLADCTAVPIPPHGRLIDADALKQNTYEIYDPMGIIEAVPVDDIDNAPTVIEAEE